MIKSILLKPFGHFEDRKFYFTSGINLIHAENEGGKTTLFMALQAALLGFIPAGQGYPYFPWGAKELYIEAELYDGRIIKRRITSSISGFLEDRGEVTALANRPLDEFSRSYVENFHLLQAEDLYELEESGMDKIIEEHLQKLYAGDGPSYQDILKLLEEKQRIIYKKRGKNYLLYDLEEELGQLEAKGLRRQEAIKVYQEKEEALQQMKVPINSSRGFNHPLNPELAQSLGYQGYEEAKGLEDLLKEKNNQLKSLHNKIADQSSELSQLQRWEELKKALEAKKNNFALSFSLSMFLFMALGLGYIIRKSSVLLLASGLFFLSSLVWGLAWWNFNRRENEKSHRQLIQAGFFSKDEFLESYQLQKELSFSLDELLSEKNILQEEINLIEKNQQCFLMKLKVYGPLGLDGLKQDLDLMEKGSPDIGLLEEEYYKKQLELLRLEEIINMPLEDYEQLKNKKDSLIEEYNRYAILQGLIRTSYEDYRRELLPKILKPASYYLRIFTGKNYQGVLNTSQGEYYLQKEKDSLLLRPSMSKGLRSQFYLALRLAVAEIMGQELPLFFDEAFSNWDENRLRPTLELLQELPRQQFIFTCKKRDALLFEEYLQVKAMKL